MSKAMLERRKQRSSRLAKMKGMLATQVTHTSIAQSTGQAEETHVTDNTLMTDTIVDDESDKTAYSGFYARLDWLVAQYIFLRGEGNSEQWMKIELWSQLKNGGYLGAKLTPPEVFVAQQRRVGVLLVVLACRFGAECGHLTALIPNGVQFSRS